MKRLGWILILFTATAPAWSATRKISVQELKELLITSKQASKSDAEVATQLKQVELTEELSTSTMNSLGDVVPGPLTTEQLYVLEARSAVLPPPAADLPSTPAPDAAAQQAILAKAADYASKTYAQLPHLAATRMTARFQDGVEAIHTGTGMHSNVSQNSDPLWDQTVLYVRLMNTHTDPVESENGIEKPPAVKDKTPWGANSQVASVGPLLTLSTILQEATASGSTKFLRWETVNSKPVAVFSFAVDKKKTHYSVNYCCFPDSDTIGTMHFSKNAGQAAGGGSSAGGNLQTATDWKNFKASVGYHGELFIDSETGTIVRTITEAEFKPTDFVHNETVRTDYAPITADGKTYIVPIRGFTAAEVVANGDSFAAKYSVRHTFVTQDYKDYQLGGATASAQK